MKISDSGIIISIRKYSESALVVKVLSHNHGLYSGFIRGGTSSQKNRAIYQNFNLINFEWSSRIEDNLGFFKIELKKSYLAEIISSQIKLAAIGAITSIIEHNILEREPHPELFDGLSDLLNNLKLDDKTFLKEYIKFEIELLSTLGYGIDLSSCAATGSEENLHFVSPKSARAVCFSAGEKYQDKLFLLPKFLLEEGMQKIEKEDLLNGLKLSGFFIDKYLAKRPIIIGKEDIFTSRNQLLNIVLKSDF